MLDEAQAFLATTATEPTAALVNTSVEALTGQAFQATTVTIESPLPLEISECTSVPTEAIAATSVPWTLPPADTVTISQEFCETSWRPLLQVDRVVWPSIPSRLQTTAAAAIQQMADGLLSICASEGKVLGLASCAPGEGVTTLLLAATRNLLSQGRKVVLVDANWSNPQLAQSLGLLPQIGWEETLSGGLPLEEVVIESLADGLAVLPVREPSASTIAEARIAASFDILAREFDVVLVDLGALAQVENGAAPAREGSRSRGVAARMDAVILVQNVRVTTPSRLAEAHQSLVASNLRHVGTIQNLVAG
jgi:Mrp family chromosome partitioning ATPase